MSSAMDRIFVAGAVALVCACGCAQKSQRETEATTANTPPALAIQPANSATSKPAVRAYIDPVTGELRDPTAQELAAEAAAQAAKKKAAAATSPSDQPRQHEVVLPNGAVEITLDPSTQHPLRACIQKNGELTMDHECADARDAKP